MWSEKGKTLYCLDCDQVLPEMPDWMLIRDEQERIAREGRAKGKT